MAQISVQNLEGKKVSELNLEDKVFSVKGDNSLLHKVVCWQLAKKRQGTHSTKTRSEVRGGGKKPFRQKGTGNARQGSIRSPLLEGGAVVHGPQPRKYDYSLPKKIKKQALSLALSTLMKSKQVVVLKELKLSSHKTKDFSNLAKKLKWDQALLVDSEKSDLLEKACRNLKKFKYIQAEGLNVYDLLKFKKLVITEASLKTIYKKCGHVSVN